MHRGVLILVDEIQGSDPRVRQLVAACQELVGPRANVALIKAGLPAAVSATLNDRVLTFLNRAGKLSLGPLAPAEIDALFAKAFIPKRRGVTQDYAQKYRKRLISAGIIEPVRRGYVLFAAPYLADHLRRTCEIVADF